MYATSIIGVFANLTLLAGVAIIFFLCLLAFQKLSPGEPIGRLLNFIKARSLWLAWLLAVGATAGSLYLSEGMGWEPCRLCWFQRILMYPQVIIGAVALAGKDKAVWRYLLPLSLLGILVAAYHYYIQLIPSDTLICSAASSVSCEIPFTKYYGFITIPLMSLTVFISISVFAIFNLADKDQGQGE